MRYAASIPEEGSECYWITQGPYDAGVGCVYGPQTGDTEQTARLWVASKDLFEAAVQARGVLRTVLGETTDETARGVLTRRIETLSAAIARATGAA